jgi:hypothetical protein
MKSKKKLKKIYFSFFVEYGEHDVFFDEEGRIIDYWSCNDAGWRGEYFAGLMTYMGFEVEEVEPSKGMRKTFENLLIANGELEEEDRFEA